ncbi:hypothetical protein D3C72_1597440 [compost metagenome]
MTTLCSDSTDPIPLTKRGTSCCLTLTTRTGMAATPAGFSLPERLDNHRAAPARARRRVQITRVRELIRMLAGHHWQRGHA